MIKLISFIISAVLSFLSVFGISFEYSDKIYTKSLIFTVENKTDIFLPGEDVWNNGTQYPTVICLEGKNGEESGKRILTKGGDSLGSAPFCLWLTDGREDGTLIVSGKYGSRKSNDLFVSSDRGRSFYKTAEEMDMIKRSSLTKNDFSTDYVSAYSWSDLTDRVVVGIYVNNETGYVFQIDLVYNNLITDEYMINLMSYAFLPVNPKYVDLFDECLKDDAGRSFSNDNCMIVGGTELGGNTFTIVKLSAYSKEAYKRLENS